MIRKIKNLLIKLINFKKKYNWDFEFLKTFDFDIIFIVGARYSKDDALEGFIHKYFKKSKFILVEPDNNCNEEINHNYKKLNLNYELHNISLDSKSSSRKMFFRGGKTSFHKSISFKKKNVEYDKIKKINTTTFDFFFKEFLAKNKKKKILLKLDTEGSELEILKGCKKNIENMDTIIIEVSNVYRFEKGCSFYSLSNFLSHYKFFSSKIIYSNVVLNTKNQKFINFQDVIFSKKDIEWTLHD